MTPWVFMIAAAVCEVVVGVHVEEAIAAHALGARGPALRRDAPGARRSAAGSAVAKPHRWPGPMKLKPPRPGSLLATHIEQQALQTFSSCPIPNENNMFLTFDDGPNFNVVEHAQSLAQLGVPASYFWVGDNVAKHEKAHPGDLAKVRALGHTVAAHTWDHPNLGSGTYDHSTEFDQTDSAIEGALHLSPNNDELMFFRPPYGSEPPNSASLVEHYDASVQWSIDTMDWDTGATPTTASLVERIVGDAGADFGSRGHIVLMHEGKNPADAADKMKDIVKAIREKVPGINFRNLDYCLKHRQQAGAAAAAAAP